MTTDSPEIYAVASATGTMHGIAGAPLTFYDLPGTPSGHRQAQTLCGRDVLVQATYNRQSWDTAVAEYRRIGATHQTFTCGQCVRRVPERPKPGRFTRWYEDGAGRLRFEGDDLGK